MEQGQQEIYAEIINDSAKKLRVVKMLSNFFSHKQLFEVYVRTKVIHNLFEANKGLDIHRLELFHLQYTTSFTDLFIKLKKAKEQQYMLLQDEIYINEDLIEKLEKETRSCSFATEAKQHAFALQEILQQFHAFLKSDTKTTVHGWDNSTLLSMRRGQEFYRKITGEQFTELTQIQEKEVYCEADAVIEKTLLEQLNRFRFRIKFTCGLQFEGNYIEVFDFVDSNEQFIFINKAKAFYFLDKHAYPWLDLSKNQSGNRAAMIEKLKSRNDVLKGTQAGIKTVLPDAVQQVLKAYLDKISEVNFINELQNVDEQTNILRAMLNININAQ